MFIRRSLRGLLHVSTKGGGGSTFVSSSGAAASLATAAASGEALDYSLLRAGAHFTSCDLRPAIGLFRHYIAVGKFGSVVAPSKNRGQNSTFIFRTLSSAAVKHESSHNDPTEKSTSGEEKRGSDASGPAGKPVRGGPISWLSFLLLALTGAGLVYYYDKEKKRHIEELKAASITVKQGPSIGKAAIGGPFKLVNHEGKSVTEKDFMGKWTVIYFGFTHCPDICPEELQKLVMAIDEIKKKAGIEVVPVFISVDPERDTVEQVREYIAEFHPALIGLTGSVDEIKEVARAFRVYYMKTEEEGSDYLVDHSIVMYLMDPGMEFVKFFGKNHDVDSLTDGIINEIKQYKK
ncbi:protein SCO1 homolog 1, mitochondrial [Nymphaea colorata]|nr:protein SCO1 homolog 1, mitochondrial [Nymphaea colorata]